MDEGGHALFDTAIGVCGIAWGPGGMVAVQLPEADAARTRARLLKGLPPLPEVARPPAEVRAAIEGVQALMNGESRDLCEVSLDMSRLTPFQREVYAIARAIPPGQTRTYGEIARELGDLGLSRAVGQALGHNPFAPIVPCHRVLAAGNRPGGFSAGGGAITKLRMLTIEGARPSGTAPLFDDL
ncbi:methylated-DNA--[protein]-cysteine S-methyltransferase [Hydrogenophaga sp.]|uniref:methylated-DNA--[protein]-cysteine S-methyltransferase n=1 Tax=Hydrogenophaga sp. TaxID=1904254 RepID=UPI00272F18BB|nr:methylated-DNA--[protein]-cysteine S-methyltransferase [Hydrogenophaga sp.]MDP2018505.1 methylated-DNA--[protein]-cysteine S-methyltransferase [Hydrogenophaga sp.]MDP3164992.1 methylated-DNA--[protein]-cysteine S-methyltransferase [Hydrogenophaga sp.]MDP3810392.1 methylated-DNA--[protein]-cysteine S-methyltransferase [Hydrogenophaga sp.]